MERGGREQQSLARAAGQKQAREHERYVRNYRAVGVLWAAFTICLAIVDVLALVLPYWVGNADGNEPDGNVGLFRYCSSTRGCVGRLDEFDNIVNAYFKAATVLVCVSCILVLLCVLALLLFFCAGAKVVYCLCGWMQLFACACLTAACIVYPFGWSAEDNRPMAEICGPNVDSWNPGDCSVRWAYILAIIAAIDALLLATLGFTLAVRHVSAKKLPQTMLIQPRPAVVYPYGPMTSDGRPHSPAGPIITEEEATPRPSPHRRPAAYHQHGAGATLHL